jgi:hypothetical protein
VLIIIFGFIAAIVGSLLIGYSYGLRAGKRKHSIAKDMRIAELEATQSGNRSMGGPVADRGNVPLMEPTTDHERAIAQAVDEKVLGDPGNLLATIIAEVAESLDFVMSASDSQFLVNYVQWRRTHPISPSN